MLRNMSNWKHSGQRRISKIEKVFGENDVDGQLLLYIYHPVKTILIYDYCTYPVKTILMYDYCTYPVKTILMYNYCTYPVKTMSQARERDV